MKDRRRTTVEFRQTEKERETEREREREDVRQGRIERIELRTRIKMRGCVI
jgi:hypothetical protein